MKCHILEVSDSGAKLVPADPLLCPKEFVLKPQIGPSDECEVVWRKGTQVGVTYVSEAVSIKESANDRGVALYAPDKVHERAVLQDAIEQLFSTNKDQEKSSAFLVVSIVNSTQVTNTYGDAIIDTIVLDVAWRLRACLRASDIIGRLSEDKLGIILPSFRDDGAAVVADKIRALGKEPVTTAYGPIALELAAEYVLFPSVGLTAA